MSEKAYFYLTLPINKQNNRIWTKERPIEDVERPFQDEKVLAWAAMSSDKIYGPYFFKESVNQHNYLRMLKDFSEAQKYYQRFYFQQDEGLSQAESVQPSAENNR